MSSSVMELKSSFGYQNGENKAESTESNGAEADPDTIKMFVGQIPRHWDEPECRTLFEEYGPVYHLNILRDKATNGSRGCCFVTYFHRKDAIAAQNALHNIRVLPQMHHPVQMKPADVENRNERKLFVGMISKNLDENDVRNLFKEYGQIEECTVLREEGRSRGCAFVTYCNRACAHQAIRKMNHSQTFEGCSKPIVVKFADTQKDKEGKNKPGSNEAAATSPNPTAVLNQLLQSPAQNMNANLVANQLLQLQLLLQQPGLIPLLGSVAQQQQIQQQTSFYQQQKVAELFKQGGQENSGQLTQLLLSSGLLPGNPAPLCHYSTLPQTSTTTAADLIQRLSSPIQHQSSLQSSASDLLQKALPAVLSSQLQFNNPLSAPNFLSAALPTPSAAVDGGQFKGPDGCNLFIYHLPQDFADNELHALFSHFGKVLSAKVFVDKQTNLSKCFGFVSYDNATSAQNAISAMNGFSIGSKRLKVQLKRNKDKPYQRPTQGDSQGSSSQ
ncbi:RNA recognition motif domain-containing protein [Ditylenchus destructor]|uniref:RNA recognition motif domain-containing protein n=1 Tax=Ditylenchus destructor TaxID=166010 RepID=A0AAD4QYW7_9BILA|nr:RNA recognition motif domain-containing protein [Ditylenchus destructor]